MKNSEQINELSAALSKAQGEITCAIEDKINPHFKSKYASLNSIWDACRQPLSKNSLAVFQILGEKDGQIFLITTLSHSSGQWITSELPLLASKTTPQALGSALTYMRRYALASLVGVTSGEDDDGNDAQAVERQPSIDLDAFEKRNFLDFGQPILDYVKITAEKAGISEKKIWEAAYNNYSIFQDRFEKWKKIYNSPEIIEK